MNWSGKSFRNTHGSMAQGLADLTFEVSNTSLPGVMPDNLAQGFLSNIDLTGLNPVRCHLPRQKITPGDLELFVRGVTRKINNFHAIAQWSRYCVKNVRCRNEHDSAEIEWHAEIIISEAVVLLWIEDFEQCRSRIALDAATELVDFVDHHHAVA
jgi:hypothetical protein